MAARSHARMVEVRDDYGPRGQPLDVVRSNAATPNVAPGSTQAPALRLLRARLTALGGLGTPKGGGGGVAGAEACSHMPRLIELAASKVADSVAS